MGNDAWSVDAWSVYDSMAESYESHQSANGKHPRSDLPLQGETRGCPVRSSAAAWSLGLPQCIFRAVHRRAVHGRPSHMPNGRERPGPAPRYGSLAPYTVERARLWNLTARVRDQRAICPRQPT